MVGKRVLAVQLDVTSCWGNGEICGLIDVFFYCATYRYITYRYMVLSAPNLKKKKKKS